MLTELKRFNSIGSNEGLLFLITILLKRNDISITEVLNRCSLEKNIKIICPAAIAFLEYLDYITVEQNKLLISPKFKQLNGKNDELVLQEIIHQCVVKIIADGIFDSEGICFNSEKGELIIKNSVFPLEYALIRNFLISQKVLKKYEMGGFELSENFEENFSNILRERRKKISLEELLKKQEDQAKRGLEAEEFVLAYERNRIPSLCLKIKRISDFDVSAGYDIVSFENEKSCSYDRFIEVKCYKGKKHFYWSANECETAKIKKEKYVLCLVDYDKIDNPHYIPEFIVNPYENIFFTNNWLVETSNFEITYINN